MATPERFSDEQIVEMFYDGELVHKPVRYLGCGCFVVIAVVLFIWVVLSGTVQHIDYMIEKQRQSDILLQQKMWREWKNAATKKWKDKNDE